MAFGLSTDASTERDRKISYPHEPVSITLFLALENAIAEAWRILHADRSGPFDPEAAIEPDFTAHLHEILEDRLLDSGDVEGFTRDVFTRVMRPELRNYDWEKPSKKPDMVVALADRPNVKSTQDGIFIECKMVDSRPSRLNDYCDHGINRFIIGDYAWAMTEALMVGFKNVHDKPSTALESAFKRPGRPVHAVGKLRDCNRSMNNPPTAVSVHKRTFKMFKKRVPKIKLRHLWLS